MTRVPSKQCERTFDVYASNTASSACFVSFNVVRSSAIPSQWHTTYLTKCIPCICHSNVSSLRCMMKAVIYVQYVPDSLGKILASVRAMFALVVNGPFPAKDVPGSPAHYGQCCICILAEGICYQAPSGTARISDEATPSRPPLVLQSVRASPLLCSIF